MRRREFILALGGGFLILPSALQAQRSTIPVIGILQLRRSGSERLLNAFRRGLTEMGLVEGETVAFQYMPEDDFQRLSEFATLMVKQRVSLIFTGSNAGAMAAKAATPDIPIVFVVGLDPVGMGLVASINRPGGNATGISFRVSALEPKRFELLRNLLPRLSSVGVLVNPDNPNAASHVTDLTSAAASAAPRLLVLEARRSMDFDAAFATMVRERAEALIVTSDPLFDRERVRLVELAEKNALPAIYPWRDFADVGGLISYGNSLTEAFRQGGIYAGRVLKGDRPAELPVWQPTKFEFVINLKTARKLGLEISPTLLTFADEVIE